jgi:alpha-aminoadipate carrier protein LysW
VANCPECGTLLDIESDEVEEGETLSCPECQVELEVVGTNPLELDVIEEEEEEEDESADDFPDEKDNGLY